MSRVGKKSIALPANVKVAVKANLLQVEGPKGKLSFNVHPRIQVVMKENTVTVTRSTDQKNDRALHGTTRIVIANMIKCVTDVYVKELAIEVASLTNS